MMKPAAWLLNFGRGHLIKDDDLVAAVKAKKIAGAVLDVFRQHEAGRDVRTAGHGHANRFVEHLERHT